MRMKTRLHRKRLQLPEDLPLTSEDEEALHRSKRRRRRSSLSELHSELHIILHKISPNDHENVVSPKCKKSTKNTNSLLNPRLFLPRLDSKTFAKWTNFVEDACSPTKDRNRKRSKQKDFKTKGFDSTSIEKTSNSSHDYETISTGNILATRAKSFHISKSKDNDTTDPRQTDNSRGELLSKTLKHRVLKDVRNVFCPNDKSLPVSKKKEPNIFPPAVGIENVDFEKWNRQSRMVPRVNYCEETPMRKKAVKGPLAKLVVSLKRMDPEDEFSETSLRTEKPIRDRVRREKHDVKIQKTRGISVPSYQSGVPYDKTAIIREVTVEKVRSISLSEARNRDQGSVVTTYKRKIIQSIASPIYLENRKSVLKTKTTIKIERNSETTSSIRAKLKTSEKVVEKKKLNVSFRDELDVIENLLSKPNFSGKRNLRRKNVHSNILSGSEENASSRPEPFLGFNLEVSMRGNLTTSTPCPSRENMSIAGRSENIEDPFLGFPDTIDLQPHTTLSSSVLNAINVTTNGRTKKRMSKKEAARRTELKNLCQKLLERTKRPVKFSQRIAMRRMRANLAARCAIEAQIRECLTRTPVVLLPRLRLNETDLSSYGITPLREERTPVPSKTEDNYGISDVETDDSTDEEDNPKKIIPAWAKTLKENLKKSYNPQEVMPRMMVRGWMQPPELTTSIRYYLFKNKKATRRTRRRARA